MRHLVRRLAAIASAVALAAALIVFPLLLSPTVQAASSPGRSAVYNVYAQWIGPVGVAGAPYSEAQGATWHGYQEDCSGLVAAAWGLPLPGGTYGAYANVNDLLPYFHQVPLVLSQLQAGDVIWSGSHALIFLAPAASIDGQQMMYAIQEDPVASSFGNSNGQTVPGFSGLQVNYGLNSPTTYGAQLDLLPFPYWSPQPGVFYGGSGTPSLSSWIAMAPDSFLLGNPGGGGSGGTSQTVTPSSLNGYLAGSPLQGMGSVFYSAGQQDNVDPRLMVAIAYAETSLGRHECTTKNPFNWFYQQWCDSPYSSTAQAIADVTNGIHDYYLGEGLGTVTAVGGKYCPGCANWIKNVTASLEAQGGTPSVLTFPGVSPAQAGSAAQLVAVDLSNPPAGVVEYSGTGTQQSPLVVETLPGKTFVVTATMTNTGGTDWPGGNGPWGIQLLPNGQEQVGGLGFLPLVAGISSGSSQRWQLTFQAPDHTGIYPSEWQMREGPNGSLFGDILDIQIEVIGDGAFVANPATGAQYVVYGGAAFHIPGPGDYAAYGVSDPAAVWVTNSQFLGSLNATLANNTVITVAPGPNWPGDFFVQGGHKYGVSSPTWWPPLGLGNGPSSILTVPVGVFQAIPTGPGPSGEFGGATPGSYSAGTSAGVTFSASSAGGLGIAGTSWAWNALPSDSGDQNGSSAATVPLGDLAPGTYTLNVSVWNDAGDGTTVTTGPFVITAPAVQWSPANPETIGFGSPLRVTWTFTPPTAPSYEGWSQALDLVSSVDPAGGGAGLPGASGPAFQTSAGYQDLPAPGATQPLPAGQYHVVLTFWFQGGVQVQDVSPPITISPSVVRVTTTSLPGGTVGTTYTTTLAATGGTTPYTWSVTTGSLPAGLSLDAATGVVSGTPTASGTSSFTVQATDSSSPAQIATANLSITVSPAEPADLSVTTTSLPGGTVGTTYTTTVAATGGTTPYTWSVPTGSLPAGLSLDASTGVIGGTPTTVGTARFTVQATDSSSPAQTATANLSIAMSAAPVTLSVTTTSLPGGTVGAAYAATLAATGGTTPYAWSVSSGNLPAGLGLDSSTGVISGTPTTPGTASFTVQATGSSSPAQMATHTLSIEVSREGSSQIIGNVFSSGSPAETEANGLSPVTISIEVVTQNNTPIANQPVAFETSFGTLSATSAMTNATGTATVLLTSTTAGIATVTWKIPNSSLMGSLAGIVFVASTPDTTVLPTVTGIRPSSGPAAGGTSVTITGTNFTSGSTVDFGTVAATSETVNSSTSITATSPPGSGTVDVTVTTPNGTSTTNAADQFTYTATPTCSGAQVAVGSTGLIAGATGTVPVTVSQLPSSCPSLSGWQLTVAYDPSIIAVTGAVGGPEWPSITANTGTAGMVLLASSQAGGVNGTQVIAELQIKAVGAAGTHTALTPTVQSLTGPNLQSIGATTGAGSVGIEAAPPIQAQLSVVPHASASHGNTSGLSISVPAAVYGSTGESAAGEEIAGYQLTVTASDSTAVRLGPASCPAPFTGCAGNVDQHTGTETVAAAVYQGAAPPVGLAFVPVRLTGPVTEAVQVTTTLQSVVDQHDAALGTPEPVTVTLQRGAVYVACTNGAAASGPRLLSVADAVAALQYLVKLRNSGTACGDVNPVALASLVPVGTGLGSTPSVADVVALLQYLVGLRGPHMHLHSGAS